MLIFGNKTSLLHTEHLFGKPCSGCGASSTTNILVYGKYIHLYWIPFISLGKQGAAFCENCKQTLNYKQMPSDLQAEYQLVKGVKNIPIWHFAGLGVLLALIGMGYHLNRREAAESTAYLNQPEVGDVITVKVEGGYSLYRVASVRGDTIGLNENAMQINKLSATYRIDKPENYQNLEEPFLKSELLEWQQKGEIILVTR